MYDYEIRIPYERVAVLIGDKGKTKRLIERETKTTITVDSADAIVTISGEDPILLYSAHLIVKAIARGFNPLIAMKLLKQDYSLEIINLSDYHTKPNHQRRIKGRIIGTKGKSRRVIEDLAECDVSVYGKTVSIIAHAETIQIAKQAIDNLLKGANHSTVYSWLERKRRDLRKQRLLGKE